MSFGYFGLVGCLGPIKLGSVTRGVWSMLAAHGEPQPSCKSFCPDLLDCARSLMSSQTRDTCFLLCHALNNSIPCKNQTSRSNVHNQNAIVFGEPVPANAGTVTCQICMTRISIRSDQTRPRFRSLGSAVTSGRALAHADHSPCP